VKPACPVTVKAAAETVPVVAGKVQPPVTVRIGARVAGRTTVPGAVLTAMLPKFMSPALAMAIGVIIVADAVAVADTWANALAEMATITIARAKNFEICFILIEFKC
jgi:hypothetical protein